MWAPTCACTRTCTHTHTHTCTHTHTHMHAHTHTQMTHDGMLCSSPWRLFSMSLTMSWFSIVICRCCIWTFTLGSRGRVVAPAKPPPPLSPPPTWPLPRPWVDLKIKCQYHWLEFLFVVCTCILCLLHCHTRSSFIDVLSCTPTGVSEINHLTWQQKSKLSQLNEQSLTCPVRHECNACQLCNACYHARERKQNTTTKMWPVRHFPKMISCQDRTKNTTWVWPKRQSSTITSSSKHIMSQTEEFSVPSVSK